LSEQRRSRLATIDLPDFGMPAAEPTLGPDIYRTRLAQVRQRMEDRGFSHVLVYADREHSANVSYLSGFDPRFEEALMVVGVDAEPAILVGNECWGTAGAAPLRMRRHMFQDFSLPSQPRDRSRTLKEILADEGCVPGSKVGLIGWKAYADPQASDMPAYIVDTVRLLVGAESVRNATSILNDAQDGLRVINEIEQIAYLEWAARIRRRASSG
jgi:hypothetical protein